MDISYFVDKHFKCPSEFMFGHSDDNVLFRQMFYYEHDVKNLLSNTYTSTDEFANQLEKEASFRFYTLHDIVMVGLSHYYNNDRAYPSGMFEYLGPSDTLDRRTYEADPLWQEWFHKIKNIEKIQIIDKS